MSRRWAVVTRKARARASPSKASRDAMMRTKVSCARSAAFSGEPSLRRSYLNSHPWCSSYSVRIRCRCVAPRHGHCFSGIALVPCRTENSSHYSTRYGIELVRGRPARHRHGGDKPRRRWHTANAATLGATCPSRPGAASCHPKSSASPSPPRPLPSAASRRTGRSSPPGRATSSSTPASCRWCRCPTTSSTYSHTGARRHGARLRLPPAWRRRAAGPVHLLRGPRRRRARHRQGADLAAGGLRLRGDQLPRRGRLGGAPVGDRLGRGREPARQAPAPRLPAGAPARGGAQPRRRAWRSSWWRGRTSRACS